MPKLVTLSQSVDNEYYCLLLAKELGLNVPDAEIIKAGNVRALAVERFDRRWNTERTVLLRLPQEDMCQTFGLPSSVKYESDGGDHGVFDGVQRGASRSL
ncbi:Protein hipA [Shigella dysenteriae WRSd3]|uniref:Protein hipA n=2 Tax=Shigella dysenteriae TaxID=622 RepID=A0A090NA31_SHIDY|nr:Protein hipA [Shigella dysenteriae WRSd3]RCW14872.1 hypothetical protein A0V00_18905 [Shigella dysenteriae]SPZ78743.1 Serine/threonine-protein kinase HipA [Shigella dysenteriae]